MPIPRIAPYPLPGADSLPPNRVDWRFVPERAVLLVHDMQRYFLDFYDGEFTSLYEGVARLRKLGIPAVYTAQTAPQDPVSRGLLTDMWGPGIADRAEIVAAVAPAAGEPVLEKHRYSAFVRSDLAERMAAMGRDQLVLCGVYAHIGILHTALDAFARDIKPFVVADATADFGREQHDRALSLVASTCGRVVTVAGLSSPGITLAEVRAEVAALLDEPVDDDESLIDAGLDSIRVMTLVESWKARGLSVGFADLAEDPTIEGFHRVLVNA
ncbi:isochorismatase family protein [Phytomonospora endophytica]|uniref:isochorismatase n=1 Tax=Phytomonospora endophytica TaxID=714109 RepID=A0A841FJZ4_9ACTN|nr:isochorismatase family protein [Phytomonospora endophytica]MBB6032959.1 bifunctional isochorismate lyase/aryl carrier protein [Phytomonospora endophytica]GIG65185.1 isochorismatase [Phytomonospora endophytica]